MKKIKVLIAIFILTIVVGTGCAHLSEGTFHPPSKAQNQARQETQGQASPGGPSADSSFSKTDQAFLSVIKDSVKTSGQIIGTLDKGIAEAQKNDELDDAVDMMNDTKKQLLYIWNQMHNHYHPDHPALNEIKVQYENILMKYIEGVRTELNGISSGDVTKMRNGFQITEKAKEDLHTFSSTTLAKF
ncbi:hypothetical protein [Aneurinibacillus terranovensis]|uniref:hypothetical protein n=1 Tax=Aneurinibacillus terranovensis TaxID=278991 RepID=UPI0012DEF4F7|nr:hypothetical protein [Aneurinibacillus terranovensis]